MHDDSDSPRTFVVGPAAGGLRRHATRAKAEFREGDALAHACVVTMVCNVPLNDGQTLDDRDRILYKTGEGRRVPTSTALRWARLASYESYCIHSSSACPLPRALFGEFPRRKTAAEIMSRLADRGVLARVPNRSRTTFVATVELAAA